MPLAPASFPALINRLPIRRQVPELKNASLSLGTALAVQLAGVATGVIAARALGPDARGQFALAMLLPMILAMAGDLGVDRAAAYFAARRDTLQGVLASSLLLLAVIQGTVAAALSFGACFVIFGRENPDILPYAALATGIIPLSILSRYGQAQLQGRMHVGQYAIARLSEPFGYLLLLLALVTTGHMNVWSAISARLVAQASVIFLTWAFVGASIRLAAPSWAFTRSLLAYGLRGYFTKLSPSDTLQLDQWLVGLTLGPTELSYYVVALAVLGPARIVPTSLAFLVLPLRARGGDTSRAVTRLVTAGILISVAVAALLGASVAVLIPLLFGSDFAPAVGPARILALGSIALAIRELCVAVLYGRGQPGRAAIVEATSAVVLIGGLMILPNRFGLDGAALSVVFGYSAGALLASALLRHRATGLAFVNRVLQMDATLSRGLLAQSILTVILLLTLVLGTGSAIAALSPSLDSVIIAMIAVALWAPIVHRIVRKQFDVFEPLTIFAFSMTLFVILRSVAIIITGSYEWRGYDTSSGLTTMLVISLLGTLSWILGYCASVLPNRWNVRTNRSTDLHIDTLAMWTLTLIVICLIGQWLFLRQSGLSTSFFIERRMIYDSAFRESTGYFYQSSMLLVPAALLAMICWKNRMHWPGLVVVCVSLPFLISDLLKGNRLNLLLLLLSPVVFYYLLHAKRPRLAPLLLLVPIGFVVLSVLRDIRDPSNPVPLSQATVHTLMSPGDAWNKFILEPDTEAGQGLMFLTTFVPEEHDHAPGVVITSTVAQPIPRQLWPDKPLIPEEDVMNAAFPQDYARSRAGATFTAMGSFYYDSGLLGVLVGMFLTGIAFRVSWEFLLSRGSLGAIAIASTLPTLTLAFCRASVAPVANFAFWLVIPVVVAIWFAGRARSERAALPQPVRGEA